MALAYKILGQSNPAAITATNVYTVGAGKSAIISSITVCNQATTDATFRIAIRPSGATLTFSHYLFYDTTVYAKSSIVATLGLTVAATDVVTIYASSANLSFTVFGSEIT